MGAEGEFHEVELDEETLAQIAAQQAAEHMASRRPTGPDVVMADPSILLTAAGAAELTTADVTPFLVVSKAFYEALEEGDYDVLRSVADEPDLDAITQRRAALLPALAAAEQFSHVVSSDYPDIQQMTRAILAEEGRTAEIVADMWVYLMTQSWIMAKTRLLLDKLYAAGARAREYGATIKFEIEEYGGALKRELIKEVLPDGVELPSVLTPRMVHRAEIKWLVFGGVWGGAAVGGFFVGGPAGALGASTVALPAGAFIRAFDHKGLDPRAAMRPQAAPGT